MSKRSRSVRIISVLLALTFMASQVCAGPLDISNDKLAPSLATDPDINPGRSDSFAREAAEKLEPGAIGKGLPLIGLIKGELPSRIPTQEAGSERIGKIREAVYLALGMASDNNIKNGTIAEGSKYVGVIDRTIARLVELSDRLNDRAYLYNAVVDGPEDYLIGFSSGRHTGLSVELVDRLSPRLLAQYVFHECIPEGALSGEGLDGHKTAYREIQPIIFGEEDAEVLRVEIRQLIDELSLGRNIVTTMKFPGTPNMILGSGEFNELMRGFASPKATRPMQADKLREIVGSLRGKEPPAFLSDEEKGRVNKIIEELAGGHLEPFKMKGPLYRGKGKEAKSINVILVRDTRGMTLFRTGAGNFYRELTVYDEQAQTMNVYIPQAFYDRCMEDPSMVTELSQTILHPILEEAVGLSHLESVLALASYNLAETMTKKTGSIVISDAHRGMMEDIRAIASANGGAAARMVSMLIKPDFKVSPQDIGIRAPGGRIRGPETVDMIRMHSEELSRIINGFARGPIGKLDTRAAIGDVMDPALVSGEMPAQTALDEYSLAANATIAAALAVLADGYVGKASGSVSEADVKVIKDGSAGLAKREIQDVLLSSGKWIAIRASGEGLRGGAEESFVSGETIGERGNERADGEVINAALDVTENAKAIAQSRVGGMSVVFSAKGPSAALLGDMPDLYSALIAFHVPPERAAEFEENPIDPGPYTGEDDVDVLKPIIRVNLGRIAEANGIGLNQMEVILLNRDRESVRRKAFDELAKEEGLTVTVIEDGTFDQAVEAALGGASKGEKIKVFYGSSGATQAYLDLIAAKPFHNNGARASMRVVSIAGLEGAHDMSPEKAYGFSDKEQKMIRGLRPDDAEAILAGKKLFTTADVKGEVDGAITFITDNEVFGLPGIISPGNGDYIVTTLRIKEKDGKAYRWVQSNKVSIALPHSLAKSFKVPRTGEAIPAGPFQSVFENVARSRIELLPEGYVARIVRFVVGALMDEGTQKKDVNVREKAGEFAALLNKVNNAADVTAALTVLEDILGDNVGPNGSVTNDLMRMMQRSIDGRQFANMNVVSTRFSNLFRDTFFRRAALECASLAKESPKTAELVRDVANAFLDEYSIVGVGLSATQDNFYTDIDGDGFSEGSSGKQVWRCSKEDAEKALTALGRLFGFRAVKKIRKFPGDPEPIITIEGMGEPLKESIVYDMIELIRKRTYEGDLWVHAHLINPLLHTKRPAAVERELQYAGELDMETAMKMAEMTRSYERDARGQRVTLSRTVAASSGTNDPTADARKDIDREPFSPVPAEHLASALMGDLASGRVPSEDSPSLAVPSSYYERLSTDAERAYIDKMTEKYGGGLAVRNALAGARLRNVTNDELFMILQSAGRVAKSELANIIFREAREPIAMAASGSAARAPEDELIETVELIIRATVFKADLERILREHPDRTFFIGVETDIGQSQKKEMMPLYRAVDEIKAMKDAEGKTLFPNLIVRRAKAERLSHEVMELNRAGRLALNNVFIGARRESVDKYGGIKGENRAWIAAIDDSGPGRYLPVFEAITLNMMAYLNADAAAIKHYYDAIANEPIRPDALEDMIRNRVIYILPKITGIDAGELGKLYERVREVYTAA